MSKALAAHLVKQGGQLHLKWKLFARKWPVTGVRAGGQNIYADKVAVTTGIWSGPLVKQLGLSVPIEAERGYHIELWEPNIVPKAPMMVASGKFVVTPMAGRIRLAGVVEFGGTERPSEPPFALLKENIQKAMPKLK